MKSKKIKKFEEVLIPTDSSVSLTIQLSEMSLTSSEGVKVSDAATIILSSEDGVNSLAAHLAQPQLKYLIGRCSSILSMMGCGTTE